MKYLIIVLAVLSITTFATAADVQLYTKVGGMELVEQSISEGHKAYANFGVDLSHGDKIIMKYNLEWWTMIEAVDDDPEMPHDGFRGGIEAKYNLGKIDPFVLLEYNSWDRKVGPFTTLNYVNSKFGVGGKWNIFYARVGGTYPIWCEADYSNEIDGRLGVVFDFGVEWKHISVGYSYEQTSFTDLETNYSGVKIGYKF